MVRFFLWSPSYLQEVEPGGCGWATAGVPKNEQKRLKNERSYTLKNFVKGKNAFSLDNSQNNVKRVRTILPFRDKRVKFFRPLLYRNIGEEWSCGLVAHCGVFSPFQESVGLSQSNNDVQITSLTLPFDSPPKIFFWWTDDFLQSKYSFSISFFGQE